MGKTRVNPDDREGRMTARAVALYEIGDWTWADMILDAYLNPDDPKWSEAVESFAAQSSGKHD